MGGTAATPRRRSMQLPLGIALIVVSLIVPTLTGSSYWTYNFAIVDLFVAVAVMQNLLLSDAGQVSFGQGAVFGLAAYTTGMVAGLLGQGYAVGALCGVAASVALGLLFALPALRVQSYYLGFVTLSAAVVFPEMLVAFSDYTNGINGISQPVPALAAPVIAGVSRLSLLIMALAIASLVFHAWFRRSAVGRRMRVAAVSGEAAMSLGFSPGGLRFLAFTIAAFVTGMAGCLYVAVIGFVSPYAFRVDLSIYFFFSVIVGGAGRLLGPVIGAWVLYLVPNALLAGLASYRLLGYGIVAFVIMLAFPDGLVGSVERTLRRHRQREGVGEIAVGNVLADSVPAVPPVAPRGGAAIVVERARKAYGRMLALDDVSLSVAPGQVHAVVGPNGSGKTTLLNVVSGFTRLDGGRVAIMGVDTTRLAPQRVARLGVGRTFQTPRVFEDMSIWDNLRVGQRRGHAGDGVLDTLAPRRAHWQGQFPDVLPHAQRRQLEILRVLATGADVLMFDEPAAGLGSEERRELALLLRALRDRWGKTVVLIEHDLHLVWQVADRITVLDAGQVVAEGLPQEILANPRVRALFTGAADAPVEAGAE
ncbi:MAG: ATP-binding cassette domain-containing protein [Rhodospirillales bacterium]|nr:ATP-binding cassette domain-containing protein [Rhodospirillales bacterium]